jgi:hypothetical protein
MKPKITLVYDADCPNLPAARVALREALEREGLEPQWVEYDRAGPGTPVPLLRFGSPTILVDGVDVAGEAGHAAAASCRVYPSERGLRGVPPVEAIAGAIVHHAVMASAPQISKSAASGALGLAFVSALGWLCCLPIASGAFGIALAAVAATVGPWWPLLATASLVFLVITVVRAVRGTGGSAVHSCEVPNRRRRQWLFLSAIGALTLLLLTLPWWSAELTYRLIR